MSSKRSRVHPAFKTKYRVRNWPEYDRGLVDRGDLTLWVSDDVIAAWRPRPNGRRGGQRRFSDLAIETALRLRLLFGLPLRQTEGFLRSLFALADIDLDAPDHTTLSRRARALDVQLAAVPRCRSVHLVLDSSGLSFVGQGEWSAAKHGRSRRRGWRKLRLGVDEDGVIVACKLTDSSTDDAAVGVRMIEDAPGILCSVTGDGAYDTLDVYGAAEDRAARVVVPPIRSAVITRHPTAHEAARNRAVLRVRHLGRRAWRRASGYHRQATVENVFFRYKSLLGPRLRARDRRGQEAEVAIACNVLNTMREMARPVSVAVGV